MEMKPTLDHAFNSASIGIISTDQFGNIAAINQQASEIIGIEKQKLVGTNISEHLKIAARLVHKCLQNKIELSSPKIKAKCGLYRSRF